MNSTPASGPPNSTSPGDRCALRDVDLDAFLHPKTIAVIGASEQSAKPNTAMTRKFDAVGASRTAPTFYPVHPSTRPCSAHKCYKSIVRRPRRHRPRDHPHRHAPSTRSRRCCSARPKFAVIFAAGFSETGKEGEKLERRLDRARAAAATCACSGRTRTSTRSRTSATTSTARRSRSSPSRATRAGPCSRARRSASGSRTGRRPATRSTSSSPTSPATSPTSPRSA